MQKNRNTRGKFYHPFSTALGNMFILWYYNSFSVPKISRIFLPSGDEAYNKNIQNSIGKLPNQACEDIKDIANKISLFMEGKDISFSLNLLDIDVCSDFSKKVFDATFKIKRGNVATYGQIAKSINVPHAARAVGAALASNPFPIIIPCHRVIGKNGKLKGFQGAGIEMKRLLLEMEGGL